MSYGLRLSAAGALTALHRQDALAHNLANVSTPGFRPTLAAARQRDPVRVEDGLWSESSNAMLERLGGGMLLAPTRISLAQGPMQVTSNPLDVGIEGEGFLVVEGRPGDDGRTIMTRDGRLTRNAAGLLIHATSGRAVLDDGGGVIRLASEGEIQIDPDGTVRLDGREAGRLALASASDPAAIRARGDGLFEVGSEADGGGGGRASGLIRQGMLEGSGVDPIRAMVEMGSVTREISANLGMIQQHDRLMEQAINRLGRVG